jgi:hypothetical protein
MEKGDHWGDLEDDIKIAMDWIHGAQDRDQLCAFLGMVMNLWIQ